MSPTHRPRRAAPATAALSVVAVLAAACGSSPGAAEGPVIVATVAPLGWLAGAVAPDAEVTVIGGGSADPHAHDLTPGERVALAEAALVVGIGPVGFQPTVEEALTSRSGPTVLATDVAQERLIAPDAASASFDDGAGAAGGHAEGDGDYHADDGAGHDDNEAGAADHGHPAPGDIDPHVWFDPEIMERLAGAVGEALAAADPARADERRAAAARVAADLRTLATQVETGFERCERDVVVVGHEAFGYLLHPHGLQQAGVSPSGGEVEPSPQRIAALADLVQAEGLPAVLVDPHEGSQAAQAVARAAGVELVTVSTLDALPPAAAAASYPSLLRDQVAAFSAALGCGSA